jgi:Tripartite tricarboxylate transporter TctB family
MSDGTLRADLGAIESPLAPLLPAEPVPEHQPSNDAGTLAPSLSPHGESEPTDAPPAFLSPVAVPLASPPARRRLLPFVVESRRAGMIGAGVLAATGALVTWQAAQLDIGNLDLPGPGFFPLLLGALIVVFSVLIGIDCWRLRDRETIELGHRDVLVVMAALLAVPLLFEPLGALATLGLFAAVLLKLVARVRVVVAIGAAAVGVAACWYFFQVLLGLQLPAGPF